jgi:hypothetical protein
MDDNREVSSDRWFLRSIRLMCALVLLLSLAPSARADDTWHNVYHSLKRFFTGGTPSPTPSHRVRRSTNHVKANQSTSTEPTPTPATPATSPEVGASPTPRVVILPAASPAAESDQGTISPAAKPEAAVKPEASPKTPVLLSLPAPTPGASPKVLPSVAPGTGNATSD